MENHNENTWISKFFGNNFENIGINEYLYALYFTVVTMITVGYGDITPQNQTEIVCSIFIMMLSCCIFAYSVNKIGMILSDI